VIELQPYLQPSKKELLQLFAAGKQKNGFFLHALAAVISKLH
jgi:hypothetical protein